LPFEDLTAESDQDHISNGVTEDVIAGLSRFSSLLVIARNSSSAYKNTDASLAEIANALGVRYLVEGSVRRTGNRLRISARLIDVETSGHVWADYFDGSFEEIFEFQDKITERIVVTVEPEIQASERARLRGKPPSSLGAWELFQKGLVHFYRMNADDRLEAIRLFREAIELDPAFSSAHAHLAFALWTTAQFGYTGDKPTAIEQARSAAETAISIDRNEALARVTLGRLHIFDGDAEMAIHEMKAAISINPNYSGAHFGLCHAYYYGAGKPELALPHYDIALRLSPRSPMRWTTLMTKGSALRALGRYEEAIEPCREACQFPNSGFLPYMHLAAVLAECGRIDEAQQAVMKATEREPRFSRAFIREHFVGMHERTLGSLLASLEKAGVEQ
jgi:TolB-like protein/Tfp pilus assembly protein PilF